MTQGKSLVEDMAILPCPFCGGTDLIVVEDGSPFPIICRGCGVGMPYMSLDDPQSERWNTRSEAAALSVLTSRLPADDRELVERLRRLAANPRYAGGNVQIICDDAANRIIAYSASRDETA